MRASGRILISTIIILLITTSACVKKLHQAAEMGNYNEVKAILEANPELLNDKDSYGMTPLHWAVDKLQTRIVEYLLEMGADVNARDNSGDTPLRYAMNKEEGRSVSVILLVHGGELPGDEAGTRKLFKDLHPLHYVARRGKLESTEKILEKHPDLLDSRDDLGRTALYWAARADNIDVVKLLLDKGADIDAATPDGWTPLHTAVYNERTEAVKLLVERGAKVNVVNKDGETPLHWAARRGKKQLITPLLSRGAKLDVKTGDGKTPVDWAEDKDIADFLRNAGEGK